MRVDAFDFDLPPDRIAQHPAQPRDAARLLEVGTALADHHIRDLPGLLRPGDLLVINDTRVIPARLSGKRGAATIEVTLHKQETPDSWRAFARPARRLHQGERIEFSDTFAADVTGKGDGGEVTLKFTVGGAPLMAALQRFGVMPLPPYIKRKGLTKDCGADQDDYQTMFAERPGAVAAPTAGLHFTPDLLAALAARKIGLTRVTLHVGAGTFLPVKSETVAGHHMHAEWGEIGGTQATAINAARAAGGRVVAVGTTALRLLETAADASGHIQPFAGDTDIFITPGYRFRAVDLLLTNFHLPRSTLFMLVCAFAGIARMKDAYEHAKGAGYRFYSYGDGSLLHPEGRS